jgi:hypothetical protein
MALSNDFYIIVASYLIVILLVVGSIATLMRGFFFTWLGVKMSLGKKVLVRVISFTGDYFKQGVIDEGSLRFKDRRKEGRLIRVNPGDTYDAVGIKCIDIDDEKNLTLNRISMRMINGYDAKHYDSLYERILLMPGKTEKLLMIIIIGLCILLLFALSNTYFNYKIYQIVTQIMNVTQQLVPPTMAGNVIPPGGV